MLAPSPPHAPTLPTLAGRLREDDVREWLANIRSAAPRTEAPLVELLSQVGAGRAGVSLGWGVRELGRARGGRAAACRGAAATQARLRPSLQRFVACPGPNA